MRITVKPKHEASWSETQYLKMWEFEGSVRPAMLNKVDYFVLLYIMNNGKVKVEEELRNTVTLVQESASELMTGKL